MNPEFKKTLWNTVFMRIYNYRYDILIAFLLGLVLSFSSYLRSGLLPPVIFEENMEDVWFQSDTSDLYETITLKDGVEHYRNNTHPLFSLVAYPITYAMKKGLGIETVTVMKLIPSAVSFCWIFTFFMLLRLMRCRRIDALLFSLLLMVSSSCMFWFAVPETFTFGSLSILFALLVFVLSQQYPLSACWYIVINIGTFAFVITNWMAGILATIINYPFRRALKIIAIAFCLVTLLTALTKYIFPNTNLFLNLSSEAKFITTPLSGGPFHVAGAFFYHSLIMPAIHWIANPYPDIAGSVWPVIMSVQNSALGSAGPWGRVAVVLWTALLMIGVWALFFLKEQRKLRLVVGLLLSGQLGLHIFYGEETFLYSLDFVILLVLLAALGSLTRLRRVVIGLVIFLIPCIAITNASQFNKALGIFQHYGSLRQQVEVQMHLRPADPWPRGKGHVVLAYPGTKEKAYYEPGGSFSPSIGSFGVSIWAIDKKGKLLATSDNIPLRNIRQEFIRAEEEPIPGILTETEYYEATWSPVKVGRWMLDLTQKSSDRDVRLMLVVRSAGPAGGPVNSLYWGNGTLSINGRWNVTVDPFLGQVFLGDERQKNWINYSSKISHWTGDGGWGYAKFPLQEGQTYRVVIDDPLFKADTELRYAHTRPNLKLSLPDKRFMDGLNAQVEHLMMGIVGLETRPGDPMSYTLSWQRDSAYIIMALANAGQLEIARQLSVKLAENDFFGGFGPEADAPGLAIWTLAEIADRLQDSEYDQFIWSHVKRKAEFIEGMLSATKPFYRMSTGDLVKHLRGNPYAEIALVAKPAKNGLIVGKVDSQFPVFYVNAVSYGGLMEAAALASRLNQADLALRWRDKAASLQRGLEKELMGTDDINDPRIYSIAIWPSGAVNFHRDAFLERLLQRWHKIYDGLGNFRSDLRPSPYFLLSEAHQWLFLGDTARVWETLNWFFAHQASPGLYTWRENNPERNRFFDWEESRSWSDDSYVTPHYWTAAEMLLLQLDMLAYLDKESSEPTIVIGAGIPKEWISHPMEVKALVLSQRTLDWHWDGKRMFVNIQGDAAKVKLGPSFPAGTPVEVINL